MIHTEGNIFFIHWTNLISKSLFQVLVLVQVQEISNTEVVLRIIHNRDLSRATLDSILIRTRLLYRYCIMH